MLELKRAKILSLSDVCGWKGISVGSPSVVTMSSFQKCWKVSKVPVLANSSLVNMKGLMFVLWYPTFAKFGKKNLKANMANFHCPRLSVAIRWTPEQLLWSIGNRVESTGWSGILTPSIYGRLGWDLCTMLFRTGGVADHFFVGSCWCNEMQITDKIHSTMFCLSLSFCVHGLVFWWFLRLLRAFRVSTNFFIGWCFPLIHMAWTSSHSRCVLPGIICDLDSYMSIPTCSNFLVSSCSRNQQWRSQLDYPTTTEDMFFHLLWLSMDFRDRNIQNYFWCFFQPQVFILIESFCFAGSSQS